MRLGIIRVSVFSFLAAQRAATAAFGDLLDAWCAAAVGAIFAFWFLHHFSEGRTSPVGAFCGVVFAVLVIAAAFFNYMIPAMQGKEAVRRQIEENMAAFFIAVGSSTLIVAALAAGVAAIVNREEWFNHLR